MMPPGDERANVPHADEPALDEATAALVRLAGLVAAGDERQVREALADARRQVPHTWVEEVLLQSYLFAGFPRALNAVREWRRVSGAPAPAEDPDREHDRVEEWRQRGEATCGIVYGSQYALLRANIRALHPALDAWMIVDGYGKVLSRPGLDLVRRELCIVAACALSRQERQLRSHLRGALNAGASANQVAACLTTVRDLLDGETARRMRALLERVLAARRAEDRRHPQPARG